MNTGRKFGANPYKTRGVTCDEFHKENMVERCARCCRHGYYLGITHGIPCYCSFAGVFVTADGRQQRRCSAARHNSVSDAAKRRDRGAFILDVREMAEWVEVHIPGSTLIPLGELPKRVGEVPRDREVVVVCRSGNRSQKGRDILIKAGFRKVTNMQGGVKQWRSEGHPTVSGR